MLLGRCAILAEKPRYGFAARVGIMDPGRLEKTSLLAER
jgi:hypothetical protein